MSITYINSVTPFFGTGAANISLPQEMENGDLMILLIETENQNTTVTSSGWTQLPGDLGVGVGTGTAAADTSTFLKIYYKFKTATDTANITVADSGDHTALSVTAIRGVDPTTFLDATPTYTILTATDAVMNFPSITTVTDNCLILNICTLNADSTSTAVLSGWTNTGVSSLIEVIDNRSSVGGGGGFGIARSRKVTAGATGQTAVTLIANEYASTSENHILATIALRPAVENEYIPIMIYDSGDECVSLTGGWNTSTYRETYTDVYTITKNEDNIQITCRGSASSTGQTLLTHETPIDLTYVDKIHCIGNVQFAGDQFGIVLFTIKYSGPGAGSYTVWGGYIKAQRLFNSFDDEIIMDVSELTGNHYVYMLCTEGYSSGNVQTVATFKQIWLEGETQPPTLTINSHTKDKISDETNMTTCEVSFSTNIAIDSWEARATDESQTPGIGVGTVVGSGSSVSAGGSANFDVVYSELVNGDRMYKITVYANIGGVWYG